MSRIMMGLTTWMKNCVVSIQIWIKCISMEGNVAGFFLGIGICWHSSTAVGFCNNVDHVGPRWMFRTWQPPLWPPTASCDRCWFCYNLDPRSSSSHIFLEFSRESFVQIDGAKWPPTFFVMLYACIWFRV